MRFVYAVYPTCYTVFPPSLLPVAKFLVGGFALQTSSLNFPLSRASSAADRFFGHSSRPFCCAAAMCFPKKTTAALLSAGRRRRRRRFNICVFLSFIFFHCRFCEVRQRVRVQRQRQQRLRDVPRPEMILDPSSSSWTFGALFVGPPSAASSLDLLRPQAKSGSSLRSSTFCPSWLLSPINEFKLTPPSSSSSRPMSTPTGQFLRLSTLFPSSSWTPVLELDLFVGPFLNFPLFLSVHSSPRVFLLGRK